MISKGLVHLIETNAESIVKRVADQVRREEDMSHIRALLDTELREWDLELLEELPHWLSPANQQDLRSQYERLGKLRFEQRIPLYECVRELFLIREKAIDFVEEHIPSTSSVQLCAGEELNRRLGILFDSLIAHLVRGYECALRHEGVPAA